MRTWFTRCRYCLKLGDRYNASAFFEDIAKHDPEAVEFAVDLLIDRLDDEKEGTRLKATFTLGEMRAESALEPIRNLAENDPSDEVRSLAMKAVHRIERNDSVP
jgi:HEAT repeat protein